jgi:tRNA(Arg) A34 adenosine deaminase TadA
LFWREWGVPIGSVLLAEDGVVMAGSVYRSTANSDLSGHAEICILREAVTRRYKNGKSKVDWIAY